MNRAERILLLAMSLGVVACGGSSADVDLPNRQDTLQGDETPDPGDTAAEDAAVSELEGEDPRPRDPGLGEDATAPETNEVPTPECEEGTLHCATDGEKVLHCVQGAWEVRENCGELPGGLLCQDGQCVPPWYLYRALALPSCPEVDGATPESLHEKAAHYDDLAVRLHLHPDLRWVMNVTVGREEVECPEGQSPPCTAPIPETRASWRDVVRWHTGENDGLWSALYLASQAFRYGATRSPEALENIRVLLQGEEVRMRITGVPGLFTRQFIPPGIPGIACPDPRTNPQAYTTDAEKDDNRWVQVREDGCVWAIDRLTGEWSRTPEGMAEPRCGLEEFAGWCWLDNVSQDEYAGHMLALGALWKLVDDPEVRETVRNLVSQVADHLMRNHLYFVDWDGRETEHGKLHIYSFADSPGFLSAMSLAYLRMGVEVSGREDLRRYLRACMLQREQETCQEWPYPEEPPYDEALSEMWLYVGSEGCKSNYNNFSMVYSSLTSLIWFEPDPVVRRAAQRAFDEHFMRETGQPRALIHQKNPWYNLGWAAWKPLGPATDGPDLPAIEDAICSLRQFPATKRQQARDSAGRYPHYCETRLGGSAAEDVIPVQERCISTFEWWGDPYARETCGEDPAVFRQPADFLLPYWMGRYFGFLSPDL